MTYRDLLQFVLAVVLVSLTPLARADIHSCFMEEVPEVPHPEFSKGVAKFGMNLFKRVVSAQQEKQPGENTVISPYSIWSALCLAFFGAEGRTKDQLAGALRLSTKISTFSHWRFLDQMLSTAGGVTTAKPSGVRINSKISNNGYTSRSRSSSTSTFQSTNKAYFSQDMILNTCLTSYLPELRLLDFSRPVEAAEKINTDVSQATRGEITSLVEPQLLTNVDFVLLNAVFFRGAWKTQFPAGNTVTRTFYAAPDRPLGLVPMMTTVGRFNYAYSTPLDASVLELPYESGFSLLVLLPAVDVGLPELVVEKLSRRRLLEARSLMALTEIEITLPKFSVTSSISDLLKQALSDLGVVDIFTGAADLRSFTNTSGLQLNTAIHQATVTVSEEGTVAAAATGLLGTRLGPSKVTYDRPFVFLLVDNLMDVPVLTGVLNRPPTDAP
nr:plasma serine protease inhibitor-like [Procambarus clarkii]